MTSCNQVVLAYGEDQSEPKNKRVNEEMKGGNRTGETKNKQKEKVNYRVSIDTFHRLGIELRLI